MAKETPTDPTDSPTFRTLREVPEDLRADMEQMVDEGYLPSQISEELEIPLRIVQTFKKEHKRRIEARQEAQGMIIKADTSVSPELLQMREKMERMRLQKQLEEMEDELDYMRRKRRLSLEREELDIERKRREIAGFYDETTEKETDSAETSPFPFTEVEGEGGLIRDVLRFMTVLAQKQTKQQPTVTVPMTPQPNPAEPFTDEQIDAEMSRYTPEQIKMAQNMPDMVIENSLKQRFPNILPQNINRVIDRIRHYGNNGSRTSNGSTTSAISAASSKE